MPVTDEFLKNLPSSPGAYMMLDRKGKVLYVGKAGNLRNRVRSYFTGGDERPAIQYLMERVDSIRTILTETEKEALILENNLIKEHRPKYNVNLRDDKSFFSLRLNVSHPFPRLTLVRTQRIKPDGERYFGPYSSARDARVTVRFIQKIFPLRHCTERQIATCTRPCLNCQMGRCLCPCSGKVDIEEYGRMVEQVSMLLQGRSEDLVRRLRNQMEEAATKLRFEEAARIRDRLASVERTLEAQNVSFFHLKDQDVFGLLVEENGLFLVEVLSFRRGNLLSGESFVIRNPALEAEEVLSSSIKQYYGSGAFVPKEVLICRPVDQSELIETWLSELRGNKVAVKVPLRGQGLRLIQLALKNAHAALLREKQRDRAAAAVERLASKLHLPGPPRTIEGYDISNISGSEPVGVKILFQDGRPEKSGYRKYKIKGFQDQDDPGMIYQTIIRRAAHVDEEPLPDLILIDGGKAQLNAAEVALAEQLGADTPPLAAIAKAREEGDEERLYLPNRKNPVTFPKGDPGLMLLMRVRDEAHRFAHTFHTRSRQKAVIRSGLDDINGIGPKKRKVLLTQFGSLQGLMEASDDQIAAVPGISVKDVERIRAHFKQKEIGLTA
ncbi:MAG: excinuclease ABC subunit UvrC [Desulfomonile tiedjei]|uniref:UvrABC system protein C n=1 Tax=Desulfomonile tiedjei TaxID=2358 RepID=A0A9D6V154_9BACT|nr:excinuclease ABC subunit UvrC [Desulfomonile tiedjei]